MLARLNGLDSLRVLATLLVVWQHAASVAGYYGSTQWLGISPGQAGVAIFIAIAGMLAARSTEASAGQWLLRRVLRIYPAYWLATLAAFALVLLFGGKEITAGLFISQMLGTGQFTHTDQLVNVVSWFISLILLCYVLFALGMVIRQVRWTMLCVAAVALALVVLRLEVNLSRHVLVFALAVWMARYPRQVLWSALGLLGIACAMHDPQLAYPAIGLGAVMFATRFIGREHAMVKTCAAYSYEFFLVHGIFLVGLTKFLGPLRGIPLAIVMACAAAVVLQRAQESLRNWICRIGWIARGLDPKELQNH